ncbi:MAG: pyridoxal phosphate-dependent aminotransferase [Phycisphaerales bacterium JB040]
MTTEPQASRVPGIRPAERVRGVVAYRRAAQADPAIDLWLDANEGPRLPDGVLRGLGLDDAEAVRQYPNPAGVEELLAARFGIAPERVILTNGGDDAIDRVCRATCEPGRTLITHEPGFEMIRRSGELAGAGVVGLEWFEGDFPVDSFVREVERAGTGGGGLVALVSPNNPTGRAIPEDALLRVVEASRDAGLACLVDLAYAEFGASDPMGRLVSFPNVAVVRTFSKARGMAGLRLGLCVAPEPMAGWVRAAGGPFAVTGPSLRGAAWSLSDEGEAWTAGVVSRVNRERSGLTELLRGLGAEPLESHANFVLARVGDAPGVREAFRARGIAVRAFPSRPGLGSWLRITLPGNDEHFERLTSALREIAGAGGVSA